MPILLCFISANGVVYLINLLVPYTAIIAHLP